MNFSASRLFFAFLTLSSAISKEATGAGYKIAKMDSPDHELIMGAVEKAYSKLGIDVEFIEYPGKRALVQSTKGAVDAELSRVFEIGVENPSLVRVPTPIFWFDATVFAKKNDLNINGWKSLRNLKVGIMRGMRFAELGTKDFPTVVAVENPRNLFKLLEADRLEVVVFSDLNGAYFIHKGRHNKIYPLAPSLQRIDSYHYVHEKHRDLVPKLDEQFKKMKMSGELDSMRKEFLLRTLQQTAPR